MNKIYNEKIKNLYFEDKFNEPEQEGSLSTVKNIFMKSELIEDILNKDLYNFNLQELGKIIQNMNPYSNSVSESYFRSISAYISWAILKGLRDDNINPCRTVKANWANQFVDNTKKIHFSYDEMVYYVEKLYNAQDQALIWMIFEGIKGKNMSEIINLKYSNINWNTNEITLFDEEKGERKLIVSDRAMRYIVNAYKQKYYLSENENEREIIEGEFIIRNIKSPRSKDQNIGLQALYNRMQRIKNKLNLEFFTANAIRQSGMIYFASEIVKEKIKNREDAVIKKEDFAIIGDRFSSSKMSSNGYEYYNVHLMTQFITEKTIEELYDIEVRIL